MNKVITTLKNINNVCYLSLNGIKSFAKVVNVKDGDTIELVIPSFNGYYRYNTRLKRIDTCEIHSNNSDIKDMAKKAKIRVIELLLNKNIGNLKQMNRKDIKNIFEKENIIVWVECHDFDKYGRLLANIFLYDEKLNKIDKNSISDILISEKLAYKYDGGTKLTEEDQLDILR
jgi:endonuclease YncB( thermonuclease family)